MKKVLISGGSGFLGKNLAIKMKNKYKVYISGRNIDLNTKAENEIGCLSVPLDVSNIESVKDAFNLVKPDIVIHSAANKYVGSCEKNSLSCIDTNIIGSQNIARIAIDKKVKSVIGISTDKATPPVNNTYGLTKSIMERMFCNLSNDEINFACVRFGNIAWSTGSVFPIWQKMILKKNIIESTGPNMRRYFFSVDEASDLVIKTLDNIKIFNGKIVTTKMKSTEIKKILEIWCKEYKTSWKQIKKREGDSEDEYLVGSNELQFSKEMIINNFHYIVIDYKKPLPKSKQFKKVLSTKHAKKLNTKEILKLIKH
ncbi:polysaccharide biosynthesis protein [Alphaproteobacteria bacterium]|nr:polysaccharide biosynthesis protein [Alphaproteobacteria bacterium]